MNVQRVRELIEAYGADAARWPEAERDAARTLARATPELADALAEADRLDDVLRRSPAPWPTAELRDRVIAAAVASGLTPKRMRTGFKRLAWVLGAGWAAAAVAGSIAGVGLTSHFTADARADAVLYQASMTGVDDVEVLG